MDQVSDDAREYVAAQSDDELLAMLGRQLSERVRALGLAEVERRGIFGLVDGWIE